MTFEDMRHLIDPYDDSIVVTGVEGTVIAPEKVMARVAIRMELAEMSHERIDIVRPFFTDAEEIVVMDAMASGVLSQCAFSYTKAAKKRGLSLEDALAGLSPANPRLAAAAVAISQAYQLDENGLDEAFVASHGALEDSSTLTIILTLFNQLITQQ